MNNLDRLVEKILADAQEQKERLMTQARDQAEEFEQDLAAQVSAECGKIDAATEADCAEVIRRARSAAQLEAKKDLLAAKRTLIDKAFEKCAERVDAMDAPAYRAFALKSAAGCAWSGTVRVQPLADEDRLDEAFIDALRDAYDAAFVLDAPLERSGKGFILTCGHLQVDCSTRMLVTQLRADYEADVADILF